jgi:hypothetical protein
MAKRKRVCFETAAAKKRRLEAKRAKKAEQLQAAAQDTASEATASSVWPMAEGPETASSARNDRTSDTDSLLPTVSQRRRRPAHITRLPVEVHLEIFGHMLQTRSGAHETRYGEWWQPYRSPPLFNPENDAQRDDRHRHFHQRSRRYRALWHRLNALPLPLRNYLQANRGARGVWEANSRQLIRNAMNTLANEIGLPPGTPLVDPNTALGRTPFWFGLVEWPLKNRMGLYGGLDLNIESLELKPDMADLLYLQELQYNLIMTRLDLEGRVDRVDIPIPADHALNRLPERVHARILSHILSAPGHSRFSHYENMTTWPHQPRMLGNYFWANPSAVAVWNTHALSIVRDTFPVIRRRLEMAWAELDSGSRNQPQTFNLMHNYRFQNVRLWQTDCRYLLSWQEYLEAGQDSANDEAHINEDDEDLAELLKGPRDRKKRE